jgi:drug/metabolite transporter (DMT)-like permease
VGALVFFYPIQLPAGQVVGFLAGLVAMFANTGSSLLGRAVNRRKDLQPLTVTVVSMGVGGILMLATGMLTEGLPSLGLSSWLIIAWLAVVNTAFAFTLWNLTLRTLSAMESSVINNSMMIQIPILALIFLGESLSVQQVVGMVLAGVGVVLVQLRGND